MVLSLHEVYFMKIKFGDTIAQGSGSLGGTTFSRNRYGVYARQRVVPVNPNTPAQSAVRSAFSSLNAAWSLLTDAQREAWSVYGLNTVAVDRLGQGIVLPGRQWYIGNNALRLQAGLSIVDDGPTTFGLPTMTLPVPTVTAGDPISVAFTATDPWATAVGGALLLFVARPKAPTVNFCKGPYLYAGKIAGAVAAPASPQTIAAPFAFTAGQRVFWRCVALTADGRVSADNWGSTFCGA